MSKYDIKTLVSGIVRFEYYRDGNLWYRTVDLKVHSDGLLFPVPISDIGNATFKATDKAMLFMRYIRKQVALLEQAILADGEGVDW